jgi:ketosteroid isomerase-like protein
MTTHPTSPARAWPIALLAALLTMACTTPAPMFDAVARAAVEAAVDSAVHAFRDAEIARDVESVTGHIAPDFYMYGDGVRYGYDETIEGMRAALPTFEVFAVEWTDIEVRALGPDAAVSSFLFRDSTVTVDGDVNVQRGPSTLIWERRGDDWLIVYVDADHYPPE